MTSPTSKYKSNLNINQLKVMCSCFSLWSEKHCFHKYVTTTANPQKTISQCDV